MPKSKRSTPISLTKTGKKYKVSKVKLMDDIRNCLDQFPYVYLFQVKNMRNKHFQDIRMELNEDSRIFMGKNRVMALALGTTEDSAIHENLHLISSQLRGNNIGLLFSNSNREKIESFLGEKSEIAYARTGGIASETIELKAGPISRADQDPLPHTMEPYVRSLGLPTALKNGVVVLQRDFTVCKKGDMLTSNQANLLKSLCIPLAEFRIQLVASYHKGKVEQIVEICHDEDQFEPEME